MTKSDTMKSLSAAAVTALSTVLQCVIGFTSLGARLGSERTLLISTAGVTMLAVIFVWSSTVDASRRYRRISSIVANVGTTVVTVLLLWAAWTYHSVFIVQDFRGNLTTTTIRAALTPADVDVVFFTNPPVPITFAGYVRSSKDPLVERQAVDGTRFVLRNFGDHQSVTIRHSSSQPVRIANPSKFITAAALRRHVMIAASVGGLLCLVASLLLWWLSRSPRPSDQPKSPVGFHIAEPS